MNQEDYKIAYENVMVANKMLEQEIERLKSIIKEAREYLENTPRIVKSIHYRDKESNYAFIENYVKGDLLEILDKGKE